jgi:hypothetical protein
MAGVGQEQYSLGTAGATLRGFNRSEGNSFRTVEWYCIAHQSFGDILTFNIG